MAKVTPVNPTTFVIELVFDESNKLQAKSANFNISDKEVLKDIIEYGLENYPRLQTEDDDSGME